MGVMMLAAAWAQVTGKADGPARAGGDGCLAGLIADKFGEGMTNKFAPVTGVPSEVMARHRSDDILSSMDWLLHVGISPSAGCAGGVQPRRTWRTICRLQPAQVRPD